MSDQYRLPLTGIRPRQGEGGRPGANGEPRRSATDTWLTPPELIDALGPFDLDPCAAPEPRPWPTAATMLSEPEGDGLAADWRGLVWCNPPYSDAERWLRKLARHGDGIAMLFVRAETGLWRRHVWGAAECLLVLGSRIAFYRPDGTRADKPGITASALVGWGEGADRLRERAGTAPVLDGVLVEEWEDRPWG